MAKAWPTTINSTCSVRCGLDAAQAEFKYSEPPPYEAERLLQRLATDPGIIEIMKTRMLGSEGDKCKRGTGGADAPPCESVKFTLY